MKNSGKDKILITGCAGFIGMHLSLSLLRDGFLVCGLDNMNSYYNEKLKIDRLKELKNFSNFSYELIDITVLPVLKKVFQKI